MTKRIPDMIPNLPPARGILTFSLLTAVLALGACGGPMVRTTATETTTTTQVPVAPSMTTTTTEQTYRKHIVSE